jgi:hypothetical protein
MGSSLSNTIANVNLLNTHNFDKKKYDLVKIVARKSGA